MSDPANMRSLFPSGSASIMAVMEKDMLTRLLDRGLSLERIGVLVERDASTVGYWVRKHGLVAVGHERNAPKGPIDRSVLGALVASGASTARIANEVGRTESSVRHWLRSYGLETRRAKQLREWQEDGRSGPAFIKRKCPRHGVTSYKWVGRYRCLRCRSEAVARRRRRVKRILMEEAGGRCALCGYDRYPGALQFHHRNPTEKAFALGARGVTFSIERASAEARKCVLLCSNCHAEVEGSVASLESLDPEAASPAA